MDDKRIVDRLGFLKQSTAAASLFAIGGTKSSGSILGANDAIRIGVADIHRYLG